MHGFIARLHNSTTLEKYEWEQKNHGNNRDTNYDIQNNNSNDNEDDDNNNIIIMII